MTTGENYFAFDDEIFFWINTGSHESPVWVLMENSEDVSSEIAKTEIEVKGNVGFKLVRGGDFDIPLNFMYCRVMNGLADPIFTKLYEDSFLNRMPVEFALTAGPISPAPSFGFRAPFEVLKFPMKKEREGQQTHSLECRLTDMCNATDELVVPEFFS